MEEEEGWLGLWLTYLLSGVGGTVASYLMAPGTHTVSLGASGAVFGLFMVSGGRGEAAAAAGRPATLPAASPPAPPPRQRPPPHMQVSLVAKLKPRLKRLLEFAILGQFVVQQARRGVGSLWLPVGCDASAPRLADRCAPPAVPCRCWARCRWWPGAKAP